MKKKKVFFVTAGLLLCILAASAAAAGDAGDPLISLSYLTGIFTDSVDQKVEEKLDQSDAQILQGETGQSAVSTAAFWTESRLKNQDVLLGTTGTSVMLLAGSAQLSFPTGTVVDVTTGSAVPSGTSLTCNHRYLVAEDTSALFIITSKTAVVDYQGNYTFSYSDAVDYNAMAGALKTLNLFKGSYTGYGQGYDLEVAPTRLQALIMFIRVLGEEDQALSWTGSLPFTDIALGTQAEKYVGYAYEKGYTNGYSATTFRPSQSISAGQYVEFMLRALGYSSAGSSAVSTALERAVTCGLLTDGEATALQSSTFLRADLVYVSYYALDVQLSGDTRTLRDTLLQRGVFTAAQSQTAAGMVTSQRK